VICDECRCVEFDSREQGELLRQEEADRQALASPAATTGTPEQQRRVQNDYKDSGRQEKQYIPDRT
jgi:hypothetical protein